ncbi:hypothetical protein NQ176_g7583 [Zarea fungicola]|uniref:Uncharacterized protein n=1 Tax=Zarea fungicola TaxID=93591 RepID=A0ACC1MXW7_9HYPO|nr:hypothetical protein NQ176_g7583 [Lecanicillium fungicola]
MNDRIEHKSQGSVRPALTANSLRKRAYKAHEKYRQSGKRKHIDYAIHLDTLALRRTVAPPPDWFLNLANYLLARYIKVRRVSDLNWAIWMARRGISVAQEDCHTRAALLGTLVVLFLACHKRRGTPSSLYRAIQAAEDAVELIPQLHPSLEPLLHNNVAKAWFDAYVYSSKPRCLENAIRAVQNAASCSASDNPAQSLWRHTYSKLLKARFELTENIADWEEGKLQMERAISGLPEQSANNQ